MLANLFDTISKTIIQQKTGRTGKYYVAAHSVVIVTTWIWETIFVIEEQLFDLNGFGVIQSVTIEGFDEDTLFVVPEGKTIRSVDCG